MVDNYTVVGTCSLCGGDVVVPSVIWSVVRPIPKCRKCGATEAKKKLPIIDMVNPNPYTTTDTKSESTQKLLHQRIRELQQEIDALQQSMNRRSEEFSKLVQNTIWCGVQAGKMQDPNYGGFWKI